MRKQKQYKSNAWMITTIILLCVFMLTLGGFQMYHEKTKEALKNEVTKESKISQKYLAQENYLDKKQKEALTKEAWSNLSEIQTANTKKLKDKLGTLKALNKEADKKIKSIFLKQKQRAEKMLSTIESFKKNHGSAAQYVKQLNASVSGVKSTFESFDIQQMKDSLKALDFSYKEFQKNAGLIIPKNTWHTWKTDYWGYSYQVRFTNVKQLKKQCTKDESEEETPSRTEFTCEVKNVDIPTPFCLTSANFIVKDASGNVLPMYSEGEHQVNAIPIGKSDRFTFSVENINANSKLLDVYVGWNEKEFYQVSVD